MSEGISGRDIQGGVFAPAFLVLRNLSYKRRAVGEWISPGGTRVTTGDGTAGVPYGALDRLAFMLLATKARAVGRRIQGRPRELTALFGVPSLADSTIADALARVAFSVLQVTQAEGACRCRCRHLSERVMVAERFEYCPAAGVFTVELTRAFMEEARAGIAVDVEAIARLYDKPAAMDMYVMLRQRFQRGEAAPLPLYGRGGICGTLAAAKNKARARDHVCERLALVHQVWPECPFYLDTEARYLCCASTPEVTAPASGAAVSERERQVTRESPRESVGESEGSTSALASPPETPPTAAVDNSARLPRDAQVAEALTLAMMQLDGSVAGQLFGAAGGPVRRTIQSDSGRVRVSAPAERRRQRG